MVFLLICNLIILPLSLVVLFSWRCYKLINFSRSPEIKCFSWEWCKKVIEQFFYLIIDIIFFVLFLVGLVLNPIFAWICILEDEEHRQKRFLKIGKLVYQLVIAKKRHSVYKAMEEEFSAGILRGTHSKEVYGRLSIIMDNYLEEFHRIEEIHQKYKCPIDPKFKQSMKILCWWESRRAHKMARLYMCERNFLVHPDVNLHQKNLTVHNNEMIKFEGKVTAAYKTLEEFPIPKLPLWKEKSGLFTRPTDATFQILIYLIFTGIIFLVGFVLDLVLLYRFPSLLLRLFRFWPANVRLVWDCLFEYIKDILIIAQALLITGLVFYAPWFYRDLIHVRSWKQARETVMAHFKIALTHLFYFFGYIFMSIEFVFILACNLPCSFYHLVFKFSLPKYYEQFVGNKSLLALMLFYTVVFFVVPMALLLAYQPPSDYINFTNVIIGSFLLALLAYHTVLILTRTKDVRIYKKHITPSKYKFFNLSIGNLYFAICGVFVEFVFVCALVFSLRSLPFTGGQILHDLSYNLFLPYIPFKFRPLAVCEFTVLWLIMISGPRVLEQVARRFSAGFCVDQPLWHLIVNLIHKTFFIPLVSLMCSSIFDLYYTPHCYEVKGHGYNITYNMTVANNSSVHYLYSPKIECQHPIFEAVLIYIAATIFITSAIQFGIIYGDSCSSKNLDLQSSPLYNSLVKILQACMVVISKVFSFDFELTIIILIALNAATVVLTVFFKLFFKIPSCNTTAMYIMKTASTLGTLTVSVFAFLVRDYNGPDSILPLYILCGSLGGILLLAVFSCICSRRLTDVEQARKQFFTDIVALEKKCRAENMMVKTWNKHRGTWQALMLHATKASCNANCNTELTRTATPVVQPQPPDPPPPQPELSTTPDVPPPDYPTVNPPSYLSATQDAPPSYVEVCPEGPSASSENHDQPGQPEFFLHADDNVLNKCKLRTFDKALERAENHEYPAATTQPELACNHLLSFFDCLQYTSISYSFFSQLSLWRTSITNSNWQGLSHSIVLLQSALTKSFNTPARMDVTVAPGQFSGFVLTPDTHLGREP